MKEKHIWAILGIVVVVAIVAVIARKPARAKEDQLPDYAGLPEDWPHTEDPTGEFEEHWKTIWPEDWPF